MTLVSAVEDLADAMTGCFAYDDTALIEEYILGTEVAVGVIDLGGGLRRCRRWRSNR